MGPGIEDHGLVALQQSRAEIERLRRENEQLSADFESCRDQLWSILQKDNDIPEQDVKESFGRIFTGIENWIDEASSVQNFKTTFAAKYLQNIKQNDGKKSFVDLGLEPRFYKDISWLMELRNLDTCHNVIISLVISRFLKYDIFRKEKTDEVGNLYPHGVSDDDIDVLVRIQRHMRDLQRDESDISRWRGQAVSALLIETKTREAAANKSVRHLEKLKQCLEPWVGDIPTQLSELLMSNVITRATSTLELVSRSNKTYAIGSPPIPLGPASDQLKPWPVLEISSWKKQFSRNVAGIYFCLYPGIVRLGESGQDDLILVQPTLLGYNKRELRPPPSPQISRSPSPAKQEGRRREREGPESTASRVSQKQASSTQLQRAGDPKFQRPRVPRWADRVEGFWRSQLGFGRTARTPSAPKKAPAPTMHQGHHARGSIPGTQPNSVVPFRQGVGYPQNMGAIGSSGTSSADVYPRASSSSNPYARALTAPGAPDPSLSYTYSEPPQYQYEDIEPFEHAQTRLGRGKSYSGK